MHQLRLALVRQDSPRVAERKRSVWDSSASTRFEVLGMRFDEDALHMYAVTR